MGGFFSRLAARFKGQESVRILMVGLDSAGKTCVLYRLRIGEAIQTLPTVGFNVEKVEHKNIMLNIWDVGGQVRLRPLWKQYATGSQALIFVLDSSDKTRFDEAREELESLCKEKGMSQTAVIVLANKQDMKGAATEDEVIEALEMKKLKVRVWKVQPTCAIKGVGIPELLDWLVANIGPKPKT